MTKIAIERRASETTMQRGGIADMDRLQHIQGRSLACFGPENALRAALSKVRGLVATCCTTKLLVAFGLAASHPSMGICT